MNKNNLIRVFIKYPVFLAVSLIAYLGKIFKRYRDKVDFPIDFVGTNWTDFPEKPIALCFGFNPWKRDVISAYLSSHRTAFVKGNAGYFRAFNAFIRHQPIDVHIDYVFWGIEHRLVLERFLKVISITGSKIIRIEDGFLRSIGGGLLHTRPGSICIDEKSIYFDASKVSALEHILTKYDFASDVYLMERSRRCLQLMTAARLTKYYSTKPYDSGKSGQRGDRYAVLIIGQVEEDASIINGRAKINRNHELILQAKKEFPDATIFYRPHPDYWANIRKSKRSAKELSDICTLIPPNISLYAMFDVVDHVYTMTSLAALEALFYGLKVTCFGAPFYSGWGLTDDRSPIRRRNRKLTIEELFAGAYLLYPQYIHFQSDQPAKFEDIAGYMVCDILKHENIFAPSKDWEILYQKCLPYADILPAPFSLLIHLKESNDFANGDKIRIAEITQQNFRLVDYPTSSHLLARTSNYDALVEYSNFAISQVAGNPDLIKTDPTLAEAFFYALSQSLLNTNGRVINQLPDLSGQLVKIPARHHLFSRIIRNYVRCLSSNLQYVEIEKFLAHAKSIKKKNYNPIASQQKSIEDYIKEALAFDFSMNRYRDVCQVLQQKPTRSERDFNRRHQLISVTANSYLEHLETTFTSPFDVYVNRLMYCALSLEYSAASKVWSNIKVLIESDEAATASSLKSRQSHFLAAAQFFFKCNDLKLARSILDTLGLAGKHEARLLELQMAKKTGDIGEFFRIYENLPKGEKRSFKEMSLYARTLRERGELVRSRLLNEELVELTNTTAQRAGMLEEIQKIDFLQKTGNILNSVPQPRMPKGVVFLASQTCFNTLAMMTPALVELKKLGYAVVNLCAGMTEHQSTGLDFIDRYFGAIPLDLKLTKLKNEWEIDWSRKVVRSSGINFYQGFYERLSTFCRRYHVDINAPLINNELISQVERSDLCLSLSKEIFENVAGRGIPVVFVSGNSHVVPFSIFRDFARHKNHPLLGFINCNVAYESYFSNLGSKFANTMCVTDMTLYPNIRAPFMARPDQFERWYQQNADNPEYLKKANDLINVNRVGSTSNDRELEILAFLTEQKALGKKIVCAFGKVPVDLNVPYDGGPAHSDMADWINHTVEICGKAKDIVLLVKPHPHELRPEIALDLVDGFHDLITVPVANNVHLLGHKDINGHALAPLLDLAILYNGSSGLELTAQGIPVVMTSYFGKHDYPVELNYPESRQQYESFIASGNYPIPSEEIRKRAAFLICYLGTEEISILNRYSIRQLTNDKIGVPKWRMDLVEKFIREGDPKMSLVAQRIVEKFENIN